MLVVRKVGLKTSQTRLERRAIAQGKQDIGKND